MISFKKPTASRSFPKAPQKQNAMVLLMVLTVFALAAIVSSELSYNSFREIYRTANILHSNEAYVLARGGENFAIQKLVADFEYDQQANLKADYLSEAWSVETEPFAVDVRSQNNTALSTGQFVDDTFLASDEVKEAAQQLDFGKLTIVIEDLQARFNVNNIAFEKPGFKKGADQFRDMMEAVRITGIQSAETLGSEEGELGAALSSSSSGSSISSTGLNNSALQSNSFNGDIDIQLMGTALFDWIDEDEDSSGTGQTEDDFYQQRTPSYAAANQLIADISELRAINAFNGKDIYQLLVPDLIDQSSDNEEESEDDSDEEEDLQGLSQQFGSLLPGGLPSGLSAGDPPSAKVFWGGVQHFFTALPEATKINVNTASAEVLETLFKPDEAQNIITNRVAVPFQRVEDIFQNVEVKRENRGAYTEFLTVSSNYFLVTVVAKIEDTKFILRSKLHRREDGEIRVIARSFSY